MSIDHQAYIGKGWLLNEWDFKDEEVQDKVEDLMDEGFLHYINTYSDQYPYFLGEYRDSIIEGEAMVLEDFGTIDPKLSIIAEELFGIDSEPKLILVSAVF